jgi:hypothetical protein
MLLNDAIGLSNTDTYLIKLFHLSVGRSTMSSNPQNLIMSDGFPVLKIKNKQNKARPTYPKVSFLLNLLPLPFVVNYHFRLVLSFFKYLAKSSLDLLKYQPNLRRPAVSTDPTIRTPMLISSLEKNKNK